ncbi:uncharacterized protein N7458_004508 [Penicillium daleae]|uniref:Extracellular protein n=1 Tax=Penicillium daleae TaxID=63821 RepID=A0AAD6G3I0_9EURO|nr:uncharacterized protein N7458_004508 [Penicillium daleae]KAJ5453552.1 hypothetical protein N7458_004508 [Penicillium daleae]
MKGIAILAGLLATGASAHMQMMKPYPIRSPLNKNSDEKKDYSYTNPLQPSGSDYPCKGYANDTFQSQASYSPGKSYELELDGSAVHGGGSCQLALTYDRGETFKVIESMLGECPISKNYTFQIPSDAPTGDALLAWTWFNKVGNREMYMNCAMVTIGGSGGGNKSQSSSSSSKGSHGRNMMHEEMSVEEMQHMNHPPMEHTMEERDMNDVSVMVDQSKATAFDSLPDLFVANVGQTGGCVTIEGESVDFPEPGPHVVGKTDGKGKGYKCTGNAPFLGSDSTSSDTSSSNSTTSTNSSISGSAKDNSTSSSNKAGDKSDKQANDDSNKKSATSSSPSSDPRVLSGQSSQVASTSSAFSNYDGQWTCTSGEILCSPDGYTWAMCSNQRPIFMGNVAAGMTCRFGQMVRSG